MTLLTGKLGAEDPGRCGPGGAQLFPGRGHAPLRLWPMVTLLLAGWFLAATAGPLNWRTYRAEDGLSESLTTAVTISPRGSVWVKHGEVDAISVLDGYSVRHIPPPSEQNYRVYESRAGKVWSVYNRGLLEFVNDQWVRYPIEEIRLEHEANPVRQVRQTPLLPAEEDRVLLLLPDRLVDYRTLRRELKVLRWVTQTGLGRFTDMVGSADGGVWVSGSKGLIRLPGPLRRLNAQTPHTEALLPDPRRLENLQRPVEDEDGGVTMLGDSTVENRRVLVHYDGTNWLERTVPGENLRFAWRGLEPDQFWGATMNSLVRFPADKTEPVREAAVRSQCFDVAVQPRGVFWLATLDGLIRYAPTAWRTPEADLPLDSAVHAILEDEAGGLWFASPTGLVTLRERVWSQIPWPNLFNPSFRAQDGLFALAGGRVAVAAADQILAFDPEGWRFSAVTHPGGRELRKVLRRLPGGKLCIQTARREASSGEYAFEIYDGHEFKPVGDVPPPVDLGNELFFLAQAQNGDYWLGGSAGPAVWRDNRWQRFGVADGYTDDGAICWLEVEDGRVWCAGLNKISEFDGKTWTIVRRGFDRVSGMTRDSNGRVWVATGSGLYRYYRDAWAWVGEEEGLPSSKVLSVVEDRARRLWVGTSRGLSEYFPRADTDPPRTLTLSLDPEVAVTREGGSRFVYQATDRWHQTPADRLFYSVRLDEGSWSPFVRQAFTVFRDLPYGKHRMEVRAMDRNWNIEIRPAVIEFASIVPWYREPRVLAASMMGLTVAFLFAGLAINRHIQLRRSYARVEKMVAERTRELERATQELAHSQKMTALGTLAAGIAHDFNNILSIIKGSAQIIESNPDDRDKIRTRVNRIIAMVDQGSGIVKGMLGFGRVGERQMTDCDPGTVVEETLRLLGDRFRREVNVRREVAPGLPPVRGARDLMQQMLLNLVLNAADALSGAGEIVLRVGRVSDLPERLALAPSEAREYVFIAVTDDGCGIPAEILPRIFEPFFTTKAMSTRPGAGLGLFMVYESAKEMGHGLAVESKPGRGSTFTILLPVVRPATSPGDLDPGL